MKKVLITGLTGFVGQHLAKYLLSTNNYEIVGLYRSESSLANIQDIRDSITLKQLDLHDIEAVFNVVAETKPDYIFHLAAHASPALSYKTPIETLSNNTISEFNLLEALKVNELKSTRVLIVATGEMYGKISPEDLPIDELTQFKPISPYAVSKITQDYLSLQYHLAYGLDVVRVRPFNHIGPGQREGFVVADFAKQVAEIEKGKKESVITVGNLEAKRDFTDVRDIVRAYELALQQGVPGDVYNLGSGASHKINDILNTLISLSSQQVEVKVDPARLRPIDVPEIVCDYSKFHDLTGWKPEISFEQTLQEILDYWRKIV